MGRHGGFLQRNDPLNVTGPSLRRSPEGVTSGEHRWPATLAVVAVLGLHVTLPQQLTLVPAWVLPALLACLLVPLLVGEPRRHPGAARWSRRLSLALLGLLAAAHLATIALLVMLIVDRSVDLDGAELVRTAASLWATNVVVFGLTFWELDGGGPERRASGEHRPADFLFQQVATPGSMFPGWRPEFVDYLYVSTTNATAFSPTDTMPLTHRAKLLMGLQSTVALATVALVAGRAVGLLG
jgi:hypothetical protein